MTIRIEPAGADPFRAHWEQRASLPMWVVTANPKDYPDGYVARMRLALPSDAATPYAIFGPTLDAVRKALPAGLYHIDRDPSDDPVIAEIWL